MFIKYLYLLLLSIVFVKGAYAYIQVQRLETEIAEPNYFENFEVTLLNRGTVEADLWIEWHLKKDFPLDVFYSSTAVTENNVPITFKSHYAEICNPSTDFGYVPQYLEDLTSKGTHCIKAGPAQTFQSAGLFDIEELISHEDAKYEFSLININSITSNGRYILQYKVFARNYPDEEIDFD